MEELCRTSMGNGAELPCPPGACHSLPHLHVFTSVEALQTLSFWVFMEASFHSHGLLNYWPSAIDSAPLFSQKV